LKKIETVRELHEQDNDPSQYEERQPRFDKQQMMNGNSKQTFHVNE
jgi:hypothetical protein